MFGARVDMMFGARVKRMLGARSVTDSGAGLISRSVPGDAVIRGPDSQNLRCLLPSDTMPGPGIPTICGRMFGALWVGLTAS